MFTGPFQPPQLVTTGVPLISGSLFGIAFVWLSLAVGRRCLSWLRVQAGSPAERGIAALGLGVGVLQLVPMSLGAAAALSVNSLRIAVAVLALLLVVDLWKVAEHAWRLLAGWRRPEGWVLAWALALVPGLLAAYFLAVTPIIDPDGLGYHLTVPKRWLAAGSMIYLPTYTVSNMPMGVEMLFSIGLAFGGDSAAKAVHFVLGFAGAIGLYLAGKRIHGPEAGAVAAALYLFGPFGVVDRLGWAYVEGAVALALVASALAWLIWFSDRRASWLRAAFALSGVAVAFKITAGLFPVALGFLTLLILTHEARQRGEAPLRALGACWPLLILAAIPIAPWLVRAAIVTGNPLFPMFARWIPSRDFSPNLAADWEWFNRYMNFASIIGASWSVELRQLIVLGVALGVTLLAAIVFVSRRSWVARCTTAVVWGTVITQIVAVGLYIRYWVPLASVLQLPMLLLFGPALSGRTLRRALVALTAVASLAQGYRSVHDEDVKGLIQTAFGLQDRREFLVRHIPTYPLYEYANRELPADVGIALVGFCGSGFYLDRKTFCTDIVQGSLSMASWSEFLTDARRLGITHALAPQSFAMDAGPYQGPHHPAGVGFMVLDRNAELFGRLLKSHGQLLASAGVEGLYKIDLSAAQ